MSDLLLDDIGFLLLRDLYEVYLDFCVLDFAANSKAFQFEWQMSERGDEWRANSRAVTDAYMAHLRFIRDNPGYAPRLTYRLKHGIKGEQRDIVGLIGMLRVNSPISLTQYIKWFSLDYYRCYMGIPQPK